MSIEIYIDIDIDHICRNICAYVYVYYVCVCVWYIHRIIRKYRYVPFDYYSMRVSTHTHTHIHIHTHTHTHTHTNVRARALIHLRLLPPPPPYRTHTPTYTWKSHVTHSQRVLSHIHIVGALLCIPVKVGSWLIGRSHVARSESWHTHGTPMSHLDESCFMGVGYGTHTEWVMSHYSHAHTHAHHVREYVRARTWLSNVTLQRERHTQIMWISDSTHMQESCNITGTLCRASKSTYTHTHTCTHTHTHAHTQTSRE